MKGVSGPYTESPFPSIMVSPLMTSPKGESARRAVFDGSYGISSLNEATPQQLYLGEAYDFGVPAVTDLVNHIRALGRGCLIFKRDLSRFFMQVPLCPSDYRHTGVVWRNQLHFFTSFIWGSRHAAYCSQHLSTAVKVISERLGLLVSDEILRYWTKQM